MRSVSIPSRPGYFATSLGGIVGPRGTLKKQTLCKDGYPRVTLYRNVRAHVAPLVCEAFNGSRPSGFLCRHLNGIKTDVLPSNLRWGTLAENCLDKIRLGEMPRGENHSRAKLKNTDIPVIRALRRQGFSQQAISSQFGVSQVAIGRILLGHTWKYVEVE